MADDAKRSFERGSLCTVRNPETIADGARTSYLGRYTFPIIREKVDGFVTVSEREIARAVLLCFERLGMVVEPTGVLGLAGLLRAASLDEPLGERVGVIISGGNVDLDRLGEIRALAGDEDDAA